MPVATGNRDSAGFRRRSRTARAPSRFFDETDARVPIRNSGSVFP